MGMSAERSDDVNSGGHVCRMIADRKFESEFAGRRVRHIRKGRGYAGIVIEQTILEMASVKIHGHAVEGLVPRHHPTLHQKAAVHLRSQSPYVAGQDRQVGMRRLLERKLAPAAKIRHEGLLMRLVARGNTDLWHLSFEPLQNPLSCIDGARQPST